MNADLRYLHGKLFRWMLFAIPAIVALGLLGYRLPVYSDIPAISLTVLPEGAEHLAEMLSGGTQEEAASGGARMRIQVFRNAQAPASGNSRRWIRVELLDSVRQPDLLVYWASKSSTFDEPPLGSFLLGVLDPRAPQAFALPQQAEFLAGYLVVYSMGQRVLVAQAALPRPF